MAARRRFTSWEPDWPVGFPGVITDRATTDLGAQNSERDPQRTAATAAALMIGLALVTLMATFAAGIIKPFEDAVDQIFIADYAITAQNNFDPLPPSVARCRGYRTRRRGRIRCTGRRGSGLRPDGSGDRGRRAGRAGAGG